MLLDIHGVQHRADVALDHALHPEHIIPQRRVVGRALEDGQLLHQRQLGLEISSRVSALSTWQM
jgi:hypothetical protein